MPGPYAGEPVVIVDQNGNILTTFGGQGTVTSVGMTVPSILSVSGSPITTNGTLAVTLANENANLVFAGPSSGGAAAPTFRSLVAADFASAGFAQVLSKQVSTSDELQSTVVGAGTGTFATGYTIPANTLAVGVVLRVTLLYITTVATTPVTMIFLTNVGGVNVYTSATITPTTQSNKSFGIQLWITATAAPSASSAVEIDTMHTPFVATAATSTVGLANGVAQTVNLATNGTLAIQNQLTFGANSATNNVWLRQMIVEQL